MRRSGSLVVNYHSHGILWWCLVGWWWRPAKWVFWFIVADVLKYKSLTKRKK